MAKSKLEALAVINGEVSKKHKRIALKNARKLGLDCLDSSKAYELWKIREKNPSSTVKSSGFIITGYPQVITNIHKTWLGITRGFNWFKTSPILKVTRYKYGLRFETENSIYKLISLGQSKDKSSCV